MIVHVCTIVQIPVIVTKFFAQRSEIARTECVQRANPRNCCKGRCQLVKKVAAAERNTHSSTRNGQKLTIYILRAETADHSGYQYVRPDIQGAEIAMIDSEALIPASVEGSGVFHPPRR